MGDTKGIIQMKDFDFFDIIDYVVIFTTGILFSMLLNGLLYSLNQSRIMAVIALALIIVAITGFTAYKVGKRHEKISNKAAYYKGVEYGREIGRKER